MSTERSSTADPPPASLAPPIECPMRRAAVNPELRLSRDGLGMPAAVWSNTPEPGTVLSPAELRTLAMTLLETADRLEGDAGQAVADAQLVLFEPLLEPSSPQRASVSEGFASSR